MNGSVTGAVPSATGVGSEWMCSTAAPLQALVTDPSQIHPRPTSVSCHHPHAILEQGKGKQAAQCGLQSPGTDTLLEGIPGIGLTPPARQH